MSYSLKVLLLKALLFEINENDARNKVKVCYDVLRNCLEG